MSRLRPLPQSWFERDAVELAPLLLGKIIKKGNCSGIIVETEAYTIDAASHGKKITARSAPMRDTYGCFYIYFTYGMHYCCNVTTNKDSIGAVLIRAVEPTEGVAVMKRRRKTNRLENLSSGPAKFCQAFGIDKRDNRKIASGNFAIYDAPPLSKRDIGISSRIGISQGKNLPWRFLIKGNKFVSG